MRPIDRAVVIIIAVLNIVNGVYLSGPWYQTEVPVTNEPAPMYSLFHGHPGVTIFGLFLLINGLILIWLCTRKVVSFAAITYSLFAAFFLRLYLVIGVLIVTNSWFPPSYASSAATAFIAGAYWVWVKCRERTL